MGVILAQIIKMRRTVITVFGGGANSKPLGKNDSLPPADVPPRKNRGIRGSSPSSFFFGASLQGGFGPI